MSKHTPGPWGWYRGFLVTARRDGSTGLDAKVIMKEVPDFFNDADSTLIAAAPEMLEELETLAQAYDLNFPGNAMSKRAMAVIAKARGEK